MGFACCKEVQHDNVPIIKIPRLLPLNKHRTDSMHYNLSNKIQELGIKHPKAVETFNNYFYDQELWPSSDGHTEVKKWHMNEDGFEE